MPTTTAPQSPDTRHGNRQHRWPPWVGPLWAGFVVAALLLLDALTLPVWTATVSTAAVVLWGASARNVRHAPWLTGRADARDLAAVVVLYAGTVALFRWAFVGFTQDNVAGLFLFFAGGLLLGTAGPIVYTTWARHRPLATLGLGLHRLRATLTLGVVFAGVQFAMTLWGYELPAPVDWVPLLVMSLAVGLFEAIFSADSSRPGWRRASES